MSIVYTGPIVHTTLTITVTPTNPTPTTDSNPPLTTTQPPPPPNPSSCMPIVFRRRSVNRPASLRFSANEPDKLVTVKTQLKSLNATPFYKRSTIVTNMTYVLLFTGKVANKLMHVSDYISVQVAVKSQNKGIHKITADDSNCERHVVGLRSSPCHVPLLFTNDC